MTLSPWNFFKEIFVINLPHREDRRAYICQHLEQFEGLEYKFFQGVYGKDSKYLIQYALERGIVLPTTKMSASQIACLISHYLIWEQCLLRVPKESKGYWILVCEDDVAFHPDFTNEHLQEYLDLLPEDAKYFKFGYQVSSIHSLVTPVNSHWNKLEKTTFSTICYAIHTDMLLSFLTTKYIQPLDWYPILNAYGMRDFLVNNKNQDFFKYYYCNVQNSIIYKYIGYYNGVVGSFQNDTDSDVNLYTTKYHNGVFEPS